MGEDSSPSSSVAFSSSAAAAAFPASSLTPSQVVVANNKNNNDPSGRGRGEVQQHQQQQQQEQPKKRRNNRPRRRRNKNEVQQQQQQQPSATAGGDDDDQVESSNNNNNNRSKAVDNKQRSRQQQQQRKKNKNSSSNNSSSNIPEETTTVSVPSNNNNDNNNNKNKNKNKNKKRNNNKGRRRKKRYPWRQFVPDGEQDPITLEDLVTLEYPPFALVATEPYTPVPVWPIPSQQQRSSSLEEVEEEEDKKEECLEEMNRKRLQEQWGQSFVASSSSSFNNNNNNDKKNINNSGDGDDDDSSKKRHYHLYDGRALAYYLVSQLQFIDPLNRRDLTRPELVNLDEYLKRHGFKDIRVTDAYDAKGITLSSAGSAANTAQGRADIMQQLAQNLLNSLFSNLSVSSPSAATTSQTATATQEPVVSSFSQGGQYQTTNRQQSNYNHHHQSSRQQERSTPTATINNDFGRNHDGGFYYNTYDDAAGGGLMVIDDDENPGMRDANYETAAAAARGYQTFASSNNPFYSSGHITELHGSGGGSRGSLQSPDAFPALSTTTGPKVPSPPPVTLAATQPTTKAAPKSKTLSCIAGSVRKTDPDESQRQWEAREEARRRAVLSNLSFGVDASMMGDYSALPSNSSATPPSSGGGSTLESSNDVAASEGQLLRNRTLADALGVKPATVRKQFSSGWARPTDPTISKDEFGNELNAAIYPDSLILEAKDKMQLLLRIEKKWKTFLIDDSAASLPLNSMDRPSRKFVHEYSDFWNLGTESFDPEPRRYIHCSKMTNTMMPHPLLSDVARTWRGPAAQTFKTSKSDHPYQQTAGQSTRSIPPITEQRVPLSLKPRSIPEGEQRDFQPVKTEKGVPGGEQQNSNRFDSLSTARERPKVALAKRSVPLELPPFEPQKPFNLAEDMKRSQEKLAEKKKKEREQADKRMRALEDAFASDDEDDAQSSSDSDWGQEEPLYKGDSEDD